MTPPMHEPGSPRHWLKRAKGNLLRAKVPKPEGTFREDDCFDLQQAAEKAIKAVLVHLHVAFPRVHDLGELFTLVEQTGSRIPPDVRQAIQLSKYAVETRYPFAGEPVGQAEYDKAVRLAEAVFRWAEQQISGE